MRVNLLDHQSPDNSFHRKYRQPERVGSHPIFLLLQLSALALFLYWLPWVHLPLPGFGIAVVAVLAAAMSLQGEIPQAQKAFWMLIIGAFVVTEFRAIRKDRDEYAKAEASRRTQERESFKGIADGITRAIADSDKNFNNVMDKTNQVLANITGGNSFGFVVPQPWGERIPLLLWNHGDQPLSGVTLTVARTQEPDWGSDFFKPIFIGTVGPHGFAPVPVFLTPRPEAKSGQDHYWITVSAQNGTVSESLYLRKNRKGTVPWAYSYTVTKDVPVTKAKGPIPKDIPRNATLMDIILVRHWSDEVDEPH
jgi:hypothetical protein